MEDKFRFVGLKGEKEDDFSKKPNSFFADAFKRFCKNKGSLVAACIIIFLILFALITPFCTPYAVSYEDAYFRFTLPKAAWFENTDFWDGCQSVNSNRQSFLYYLAMGKETGHNAIKNQEFEEISSGGAVQYRYRLDSYQRHGTVYMNLTREAYSELQNYQDLSGVQVIYPIVSPDDRPKASQDRNNANYYFKTSGLTSTQIVLDEKGEIIPVYQTSLKGESADGYFSELRIESDGYFDENSERCFDYARRTQTGYEVRVNYYEYFIFNHTYVLKDGITRPYYFFGTTDTGRDILTVLASGASFSFIFSILVAMINLFVGSMYGAIEGYFGGKIDLGMERFADILNAVPFVVVITLLKLHMGATSQMIILFLAFFITGWIGLAAATRMQFYRYKGKEYVLAARSLGAGNFRIIRKHIFPNAIGTLVTRSALLIPSMIFSEVNLSFLGIINLTSGTLASVGTLLASGQQYLTTYPHIIAFPSVFLALLMLSFNLLGNGLRDAFNPNLRGE